MVPQDSQARIERVLLQLQCGLEAARVAHLPREVVDALLAGESLCRDLGARAVSPARDASYLDYRFDDESYIPFGRQIDVRVYFSWNDYNPSDDPGAPWGAVIEEIEVLGVRYFDEQGGEVSASAHFATAARALLGSHWDEVTEACTAAGARLGMGRSHPLYHPTTAAPEARLTEPVATGRLPRLAPSARRRRPPSAQRRLG